MNPSRRFAIQSIAGLVVLTLGRASIGQENTALAAADATWDALLAKHVKWLPDKRQSRVNYRGLKADRAELGRVLTAWSAVPRTTFNGWPREQQMAFLINAYNGFTIELILSKYPDLASIKDLGSLLQSPWKKSFFTLLGETRTLDWIEHEQLRPNYADPRIHTAIVCASIGCPALTARGLHCGQARSPARRRPAPLPGRPHAQPLCRRQASGQPDLQVVQGRLRERPQGVQASGRRVRAPCRPAGRRAGGPTENQGKKCRHHVSGLRLVS